jgi:hypothetical protein
MVCNECQQGHQHIFDKQKYLINFVSEESRIGFAHYKVILEKKILKALSP